jgi:hypothetical protein
VTVVSVDEPGQDRSYLFFATIPWTWVLLLP